MVSKRSPAKEVAKSLAGSGLWIDHAYLSEDDLSWMGNIRRLTLWNVTFPQGFLSKLPELWWLDVRGGSAEDIQFILGASSLECLIINQVRGLRDLSLLPYFSKLRFLSVYGLPHVKSFVDLSPLVSLERAEVGQMKGLESLKGLLQAVNLKELYFSRMVDIKPDDIERIVQHPALEQFGWNNEDVPKRIWEPVFDRIKLPVAHSRYTDEWFEKYTRGNKVSFE